MAREKVTRTRCDRCKNVMNEVDSAEGDPEEEKEALVLIKRDGKIVVEFCDLCEKCTDRVDNLLKQLRLEKPDADADADANSNGTGDDKKPPAKDTAGEKTPGKGKNDAGAGAGAPP